MRVAETLLVNFEKYAGGNAAFFDGKYITYGELGQRARQIAGYLQQLGIDNQCVAIETTDAHWHIAAMLGVVLSGNYYLTITPDNAHFVDNSFPLTINYSLLSAHGTKLLNTKHASLYFEETGKAEAFRCISFEDRGKTPFFALITSGTSGTPKVITHTHNTVNEDITRQVKDNQITSSDKLDLVFSFSFSAAASCIYPALATGAALCIYPLKTNGLSGLAEFWQHQSVTYTTLPVSVFHAACQLHPSFRHLTHIRCVALGAEPINENTIGFFRSHFAEGTHLKIAYASSETRTISQVMLCNHASIAAYNGSLGRPVANKKVMIVDGSGSELAPGETGEIVVISGYMAHGYAGEPIAAQGAFFSSHGMNCYKTGDLGYLNREGEIFHVGRKNGEDKLNGIKISLRLIEQELEKMPGLLQVAVVINSSQSGKKSLVAFLQARDGFVFELESINSHLAGKLPEGHYPHFYCQMDAFPETHTSKINRKQLETIDFQPLQQLNRSYEAPSNLEQTIINVFNDVLKTQEAKRDSSFFNTLGGDSLLGMMAISALETQLGIQLPAYSLWAYPSPAQLAAFISSGLYNKKVHHAPANEPTPGRRNLYFINRFRGGNDYKFIIDRLKGHFNLIHLLHESETLETEEDAEQLIKEMAAVVKSQNKDGGAILLGLSFQGFLGQQLAAMLPEACDCILLDTYNYFEIGGYSQVRPKAMQVAHMLKNTIISGDYQILTNFIKGRINRKGIVKTEAGPFRKHRKHMFWHGYYTKAIDDGKAVIPNNCLFFRATRDYVTHPSHGFNWKKYVKGSFKLAHVKCTHLEITAAAHSQQIAETIIATIPSRL